MGRLAADPDLRARLGARAREHAVKFNAGTVVGRVETLYAELRKGRTT